VASYLVTGGAGFIGSNIVEELVRRGERVKVLDNLLTGKAANIESVKSEVEFVQGDIRDLEGLRKEFEGIDYVIHQAALPSVPRSVQSPIESHECNATGTLNVLVAARDTGVKRVVYASSSSVYGNTPALPKREDMPTSPMSPYAVNKLAGEQYCRAFTLVYGLPTVSLRYFNVFGPRQDPASQYAAVIPAFISKMLRGEQPVIYGDGEQSRDFTFVDNVVAANLLACTSEGGVGEAVNIALGDRISLLQLVQKINAILGTRIQPRFEVERKGDVKHSMADISKARQALKYEPVATFDEGLKRTVQYLQAQG
jgi:nucleoside-diphosphate-sugar epimerase